jgi:SPP1 gp7 family putative phage head morphogenesis protein
MAFDEAEFILSSEPFDEALKFFQAKVPMTEAEFYRIARQARVRAFTVADMASLDALKDIQDSLAKAIETGQSMGDWKKSVKDILSQWDVSGWRAETIYRTNLQTSYQVGRYEQMTDPDVLEMRPYWRYVAVMDEKTRPTHAALHGKVFPADDPFWDTWYPPNGFNCRCTVQTLSPAEVEREGYIVEKGSRYHNKPVAMPDGTVIQMLPDPGWDFNPGKEGLTRITQI